MPLTQEPDERLVDRLRHALTFVQAAERALEDALSLVEEREEANDDA